MPIIEQQQAGTSRVGPGHYIGGRNQFIVPTVDDGSRHQRSLQGWRGSHVDRWCHQEQTRYWHLQRCTPRNPGAQAGAGKHHRATCGGNTGQPDEALQARRYVTERTDLAARIEVGVVGAFVAPTEAIGDLGQCRDLGRVGTAFETMGEDAVAAHGGDASIRAMPTVPALEVIDAPLPYVARLPSRALTRIELVVVHCTELPDLATAREYGERILYPESGTGNSGHYYIDRDGSIQCWVAPGRVAHHVRGYNAGAIGIELVNNGRWPDWLATGHQAMDEPYADAQVQALIDLLQHLQATLPALRDIAGHEDLDREDVAASDNPSRQVRRKRDPGPRFPWSRVLEATSLARIIPG